MKLKWLALSTQQSSTTTKISGLQNRTLCYRSSPTGKLKDSSQFMMICYYTCIYGLRIVVPATMRQGTLSKIHQGHQGIQKCHLRASISVWWPGVSKHIKDLIEQYPTCVKQYSPHKEPLIPTSPRLPLVEDRNRFILYEFSQLPTCC